MLKGIRQKDLQNILQNKKLRQRLAYDDPMWFSLIYLKCYFSYPLAPFHLEMFKMIKDPKLKFIVVMAFRESGKSIIMNTANALWSILGKPRKRFVIIVSQTQEQAKVHFGNIKEELLYNELLREDFGPFTDDESEWKKMSLELVYHGSKVLSVSKEQHIRGMKYKSSRPDLIICDDLEDTISASDCEQRKTTYNRFMNEMIPAGDGNTKIIVLGNLLNMDSLLMRLKENIEAGEIKGVFKVYPLLDDGNNILWPGRFPTLRSIERFKETKTNEVWNKEFILIFASGNFSQATVDYWRTRKDLHPAPAAQSSLMKNYIISAPYEINFSDYIGRAFDGDIPEEARTNFYSIKK